MSALWLWRDERLRAFWPLVYAFLVANMVWLVATLVGGFGSWPLRWWGLTVTTPQGAAVAKVGEAVGATALILALCLPAGLTPGSLGLRRGHLKWAVVAGGLAIVNFGTNALMASAAESLAMTPLGSLSLWSLVFSLANGFMEGLWFRALFPGRLAPHLGAGGAVVMTAVIFGVLHVGADYLDPAVVMLTLLNIATQGIVLGWLMLKTDGRTSQQAAASGNWRLTSEPGRIA